MSKDRTRECFKCACVQFDVVRGDVDGNLEKAERGLRDAADQGALLAVLPEMWTTSFVPEITPALVARSKAAEKHMVRLSAQLGMVVVGGGLVQEDGQTYNRALLVDHGKIVGEYRKIHLFSLHGEDKVHDSGSEPLIADTSAGRIGVVICYDIRFPELIRYYFYHKVEILVVPAQWPESRTRHWRIMLKARAIENEMFIVGSNRTGQEESLKNGDLLTFPGDSRIIDPMGEVLAAGAGENGAVIGEIELRRVRIMRRILPVAKDRRPQLYAKLWQDTWSKVAQDEPSKAKPHRV